MNYGSFVSCQRARLSVAYYFCLLFLFPCKASHVMTGQLCLTAPAKNGLVSPSVVGRVNLHGRLMLSCSYYAIVRSPIMQGFL